VCKQPPRQWRESLSPRRILFGVTALALIVAGIFPKPPNIGLTLIGLGAAMLLAAVVMPTVNQVEFGIPSIFKATAAIRNREEQFRKVFEAQGPDLEECANLLCDDSATANALLTTAMARATSEWRGPIDSEIREIRTYVLCLFVHRLMARRRLAGMEQSPTPAVKNPVAELTTIQRLVVVLTEYDVPIDEVADMVGLSPAEAQDELDRGARALTDAARGGGY
jgi:DNA-directed RNA polymerase specialized sigma24 family protein